VVYLVREIPLLAMIRIRAAVAVVEEAVGVHAVFVRARVARGDGCRPDAERHLRQDGWLEDSLLADEGHPLAVEVEPLQQNGPRENLAVHRRLLGEELERPQANLTVQESSVHAGMSRGGAGQVKRCSRAANAANHSWGAGGQ